MLGYFVADDSACQDRDDLGITLRACHVIWIVLADGYEYQGLKYKSLSGVAFAITGTRWNGNVFFGLGKREDKEKRSYHRARKARA